MCGALMESKFILDAFGCSSTSQSEQTSQYGHLLDLHLDFKGDLVQICHSCTPINRWLNTLRTPFATFQIFYWLLSGADLSLLKVLKLSRNSAKYALLRTQSGKSEQQLTPEGRRKLLLRATSSPSAQSSGASVNAAFRRVTDGLKLFKLEPFVVPIFQILAAILKLSNLNFRPDFKLDGTPTCSLEHDMEMADIGQLLGCDPSDLLHAIQSRDLDADQASHVVEVMYRTLYGRLFHWLVSEMNRVTRGHCGTERVLSIFDCYGLDIAKDHGATPRTHFERYLTNYVNELIRDFFIRQSLKLEQEVFEMENIGWIWVPFQDFSPTNALCLSFLMLDNSETDREFLDIMAMSRKDGSGATGSDQCQKRSFDPLLCIGDSALLVSHYGGSFDIEYHLGEFTEKNRDSLPPAVSCLLFNAHNPLCKILFPEGNLTRAPLKPLSSSAQMETSANLALQSLYGRECNWVICVNPNLDDQTTLAQLRAFCIPELINLNSRFYDHEPFESWFYRYRVLSPLTWPQHAEPSADTVRQIIQACCLSKSAYQIGNSRVFIKTAAAYSRLESLRSRRLGYLAKTIQTAYRCYRRRIKTEPTLQQCQVKLAAFYRGYRDRKEVRAQHVAAIKIQAWFRSCRVQHKVREYKELKAQIMISEFFWRYICYRYLKCRLNKLPPMSPRSDVWERVPYDSVLLETDEYLKYLYHRWRCHRYRQSVDQHQYYRMREKLTASLIFSGHKQSYPQTVPHPFQGDYARIRHNAKWKRISAETNDEYVVFADVVGKVNRSSGKVNQCMLVASTSGIALLDHRSLQMKHRIPVNTIQKISTSPYNDNVGIFHLKGAALSRAKGDFIFECRHLIELVAKLYLVIQNAMGKPPTVEVTENVRLQFEEEKLEMIFRPMSDKDSDILPSKGCFHKHLNPSTSLSALTCYGEAAADLDKPDGQIAMNSKSCASKNAVGTKSEENISTPPQSMKYSRKGDVLEVYF